MKSKMITPEDHKVASSFLSVRRTLLEDRYADRLEKPLADWALPNDRRLPVALLDRSIGELVTTPFEELSATPGIGEKKIHSLVRLLNRATKDHPPALPTPDEKKGERARSKFDPSVVSEILWQQWRAAIEEKHVGNQKIGAVSPSLRNVPTVIWHTPLGTYLPYNLAQIRKLKTHGEKRVRVILQAFFVVQDTLSKLAEGQDPCEALVPAFVLPLRAWMQEQIAGEVPPTEEALREHLILPLLSQVRHDLGDQIYDLASGRLAPGDQVECVRMQAKRINVTRARIYQLLDEIAKMMQVRWPEGESLFRQLEAKTHFQWGAIGLLRAARSLFYPEKDANRLQETESQS